MAPYSFTKIPAPIRHVIKANSEYEFLVNTESEFSEDEKSNSGESSVKLGKDEEKKITNISLRGIIWKELGKEAYFKWLDYFSESESNNQFILAMKLYERLLDYSYKLIENSEVEHIKKESNIKKSVVSSLGIPQLKRLSAQKSSDVFLVLFSAFL